MNDLFMQGVELMILGMGFVFVFLVLLVFFMVFMSFIVNKYLPEPIPVPQAQKKPKSSIKKSTNDDAMVAALTAVSIHHKNQNRN